MALERLCQQHIKDVSNHRAAGEGHDQHARLLHLKGAGLDELRQKRDEKQNRLGVGQRHRDAFDKQAACGHRFGHVRQRIKSTARAAPLLDPQINQIPRASDFQHQKGTGGRYQDRAQPGRYRRGNHDQAQSVAERTDHRPGRAVGD